MEKKIVRSAVLILLGILGISTAYAIIQSSVTVRNIGIVRAVGLEVYWDYDMTQVCTQIDWGRLDPGSQTTKAIYIFSSGNSNANLTMVLSNWSSALASTHLHVTWDCEGASLLAHDIVNANITLQVDSNVEGLTDFSFDITLSAVA